MNSDDVFNVDPSDLDISNSILPSGMHAPQEITSLEVDIVDHAIKVSKTPEIPDQALEKLEELAQEESNPRLILVDDKVRICNIKPSPEPQKDFTIVQAFAAAGQELTAAPPSSVDLREAWWIVKDQGSTGACAGFSASSLLEYCFTKTKRINTGVAISPREIWMAAKETDTYKDYPTTFIEQEGTSLGSVLKFLQRFGAIPESIMPFNSLYAKTAQELYNQSASLRIASYYNLSKTQSNWKSWLSKYGPIYTAINVDSTWMNASKDILENYDLSSIYGGHAVLICGYDDDKDYFIFKNSWGTNWADGGYAYASSKWCAQGVLEAYGVAV